MVSPELAALLGACTFAVVETARLIRETRLRRRGEKRTRSDDVDGQVE